MILHLSRVLFVAALLAVTQPVFAADPATRYVCPPCGASCDTLVFSGPGTCGHCSMELVVQTASTAAQAAEVSRNMRTAAILIYPGVQIIDYTGPYEVFGQARFRVVTVAKSADVLTTAMDMKVVPEHTFANCPPVDVLIVPGGDANRAAADQVTVDWVQKMSGQAEYTMSVCNGAFILAAAGLLDGASATTFYGQIDELKERAPKTKVVSDQRFVDNGKVITTAGLSSGIDGSLHVVSKMLGKGRAEEIALHIEYDWRPESHWARAALADRRLPRLRLDEVISAHVLSTQGTRDRWDKSWQMTTTLPPAELASRLAGLLEKDHGWKRSEASAATSRHDLSTSDWTFTDEEGQPWSGRLSVQASETEAGTAVVSLSIARAG